MVCVLYIVHIIHESILAPIQAQNLIKLLTNEKKRKFIENQFEFSIKNDLVKLINLG